MHCALLYRAQANSCLLEQHLFSCTVPITVKTNTWPGRQNQPEHISEPTSCQTTSLFPEPGRLDSIQYVYMYVFTHIFYIHIHIYLLLYSILRIFGGDVDDGFLVSPIKSLIRSRPVSYLEAQ